MKYHDGKLTKTKKPKVHRRRWGKSAGPARRVFIAIRIEGDARDTLAELQDGLPPIPMRIIPKRDLHLTLTPPWMEKDVAGAMKRMRDVLERPFSFPLKCKYLEYGPKRDDPRLIWVTCAATKRLIELKERMLNAFGKKSKEHIPFIPHVTLARLIGSYGNDWRDHHVGKNVPLVMEVEAIELLESPHKGGIGYKTLKRIRLHREDETPR
ncbi:2'-5' RNA ligase [Candidatus Kaiserbacteria bacterium RIFCSPLOWO2_12_FULL_53_8]|uniref:2'-5' RNA ligase n=1 Tax=Candidatus Kaiserbacteria bacterium RIFCSPLOWO2_12_FULL_53_8 TaxID=1798529 RepID=A0A1F6FYU9_9BACT|nr:MAG: 2'-5' RNA ligase [Candidatus Kaiserbacteria bacterium RIFCSPLOWO2_12_FULL_53_8]